MKLRDMVRRSPSVMFSRGEREDRDFTTVPYTGRMYDRAVCSRVDSLVTLIRVALSGRP